MAVVVGAVFISERIPLLREGVMLAAAGLSLRFTPKIIHEVNAFTFGPIREVAVLFFGIFLTIQAFNYGSCNVFKSGSEKGL